MTKCAVNVGQKFEWNTNGSSSDTFEGKPCLDVPYLTQIFSNMAPDAIIGTQGMYFSSQTFLAFWNGKGEWQWNTSPCFLFPITSGRHCIIHPYPSELFGSSWDARKKNQKTTRLHPVAAFSVVFGNVLFSLRKNLQTVAGEQAGEGCIWSWTCAAFREIRQ